MKVLSIERDQVSIDQISSNSTSMPHTITKSKILDKGAQISIPKTKSSSNLIIWFTKNTIKTFNKKTEQLKIFTYLENFEGLELSDCYPSSTSPVALIQFKITPKIENKGFITFLQNFETQKFLAAFYSPHKEQIHSEISLTPNSSHLLFLSSEGLLCCDLASMAPINVSNFVKYIFESKKFTNNEYSLNLTNHKPHAIIKNKFLFSFEVVKNEGLTDLDSLTTNVILTTSERRPNLDFGTISYYSLKVTNLTLESIIQFTDPILNRENFFHFTNVSFTFSSPRGVLNFILFKRTSKTLSKSNKYYDSTKADLYLLDSSNQCLTLKHCLEITEFISLKFSQKLNSIFLIYGFLPNTLVNLYKLTKNLKFKKSPIPITEVNDCYTSPCASILCFMAQGNLGGHLKFFSKNDFQASIGHSRHIGIRKIEWNNFQQNFLLTAALYPFRRVDNGYFVWKYNGEEVCFVGKKELLECFWIKDEEDKEEKIKEVRKKEEKKKENGRKVAGMEKLDKFF